MQSEKNIRDNEVEFFDESKDIKYLNDYISILHEQQNRSSDTAKALRSLKVLIDHTKNDGSLDSFGLQALEFFALASLAVGYKLGQTDAVVVHQKFRAQVSLKVAAKQEKSLLDANAKRRLAGNPVRAAAKQYILKNPNTSQAACARHVSQVLEKGERHVNRTIGHMFEDRAAKAGGREKRPKPEFLPKTKAPG